MSQALLVIEDDSLATLIEANLDLYTGVEVVSKNSLDDAISLLELNPRYDVVICQRKIGESEVAIALQQSLFDTDQDSPMIIYGDPNEQLDGVTYINTLSDMKVIVQTIAKILGITAKEMSERKVGDLYPISLRLIGSLEVAPTDIFLLHPTSNQYIPVLEKGKRIGGKVRFYRTKKVKHLYVDANDRLKFINQASTMIINLLEEENLSAEETLDIVEQGNEVAASNFLSGEISDEVVVISKRCITAINDVCKNIPNLKKLLAIFTKNQSSYLYSHSIVATYVSDHIINNISWGGPSQKEKLNFVFFFQDMLLAPLYAKYPDATTEEDFLFYEHLTNDEKELVLEHAKQAGAMIQYYPKCPMGADIIMVQHHGMTTGVGFASNYKDDISPLSKVIIIAEAFVENVFLQRREKGVNKIDLDETREALKERFNKSSYVKIIDTLENFKF